MLKEALELTDGSTLGKVARGVRRRERMLFERNRNIPFDVAVTSCVWNFHPVATEHAVPKILRPTEDMYNECLSMGVEAPDIALNDEIEPCQTHELHC